MTEDETPNPCPWCGSKTRVYTCGYSSIKCTGLYCHAKGPVEVSEEQAIAAWNRVAKAKEEQK